MMCTVLYTNGHTYTVKHGFRSKWNDWEFHHTIQHMFTETNISPVTAYEVFNLL